MSLNDREESDLLNSNNSPFIQFSPRNDGDSSETSKFEQPALIRKNHHDHLVARRGTALSSAERPGTSSYSPLVRACRGKRDNMSSREVIGGPSSLDAGYETT